MNDAPSDARNTTAAATSSGFPSLPSGVSSAIAARVSAEREEFISVSIAPGETQFTVIPDGASSLCESLRHADQPRLGGAVVYRTMRRPRPTIDETLTILPDFSDIIDRDTSRDTRKAPVRSVEIILSHIPSVMS